MNSLLKNILCLSLSLMGVLIATAQNQNISGGLIYEGEPYLAINPSNSQHMVIAWMGLVIGSPVSIKSRVTFDGGKTWSDPLVLPHFNDQWQSADPSIAFTADGTVLFCYVDYQREPVTQGAIYVAKSMDGGLTISDTFRALGGDADEEKYPVDRPWMVVDASNGAHRNKIYITSKPAPWVPAPNRPYIIHSSDMGETWSTWKYLDGPGFEVGPFVGGPMATPAVAADGTFHAIYVSYKLSQNLLPGFYLASSSNGGEAFDYHPVFFGNSENSDDRAKLGYLLITNPADAGHLAFVSILSIHGDPDVFVTESTDGGVDWSEPVRVNDDPISNGVLQDLCWGDFNQEGDLVVSWRDRRNGSQPGFETESETWASWKKSGALDFSPNFMITDQTSPYLGVLSDTKGNDFMCTQLVKDTLISVWGDVRNNRLNIWFEKRSLTDNTGTVTINLTGEEEFIQVFPNPATEKIYIQALPDFETHIYNSAGLLVLKTSQKEIDVTGFTAGIYTLLLKNAGKVYSKKILIF